MFDTTPDISTSMLITYQLCIIINPVIYYYSVWLNAMNFNLWEEDYLK